MPAYNAERTIRRAVLSTLRAMPDDSRLVVLDDASTDGTVAVLESINDRRLSVIASSENSGSGVVRNRILAETDSEFFAVMDADDVSLPWRFTLQMKAAQSVDVVFGAAVRFDSNNKARARPSAPLALRPHELPTALLFHNPLWHSSFLARRSAIETVGGYSSGRCGQDYELWLRLADSGATMYRLSVPVGGYRESSNQITKRDDYREKVRNFDEMRHAYINLFNSRVRGVSLDPDLSASAVSERIQVGLREQLQVFRPLNRVYYSRLVRTCRSSDLLMYRVFPDDSATQ
jgi:glycosyltransferase involved in cell wall biosynthesis